MVWFAKAVLFLFLLPFAAQARAASISIGQWGGIDEYSDSSMGSQFDALDAENVFTDRGYLEKRDGFLTVSTAAAGTPIRYFKRYLSVSGEKSIIFVAGAGIYKWLPGEGVSALGSFSDAAAAVTSVTAFGREYFSNGIDPVQYYDGYSMTEDNTVPKCQLLEFDDERLYCANTYATGSTIYASKYGNPESWSIPTETDIIATDPAAFTFGEDDGDYLTCFKKTPFGKFIGKPNASYLLTGQDNDSYAKHLISPTVGCMDNDSVQMVNGKLVWLGQDGIYAWDGANAPVRISLDIDTTAKSITNTRANQGKWLHTRPSDWGWSTVYNDTNTWDWSAYPGSMVLYGSTTSVREEYFTNGPYVSSGTVTPTGAFPVLGEYLISTFTFVSSQITSRDFQNFTSSSNVDTSRFDYVTMSYGDTFLDPDIDYNGADVSPWLTTGNSPIPIIGPAYRGGNINFTCQYGYFRSYVKNSTGTVICENSHSLSSCSAKTIKLAGVNIGDDITMSFECIGGWTGNKSVYQTASWRGADVSWEIPLTERYYQPSTPESYTYYISSASSPGYATFANWQSNVVDSKSTTNYWRKMSAFSYVPDGSTITYRVRTSTGSDIDDAGAWSDWETLAAGQDYGADISSGIAEKRYLQFDFTMTRTEEDSPQISSMTVQSAYSGTYESSILNFGFTPNSIGFLTPNDEVEGGITYSVRTCSTTADCAAQSYVSVSSAAVFVGVTPRQYVQFKVDITAANVELGSDMLDWVDIYGIKTGSYLSPVHYTSDGITAWGPFIATSTGPASGTNVVYYIRGADTVFNPDSADPAWVEVENDSLPSISIYDYVQWKLDATGVEVSTTPFRLDSVAVNWREGNTEPSASLFYDGRYYLSISTSSGEANKTTLVYQRNGKWTKMTGPGISGFAILDNIPYAADSSTDSRIWRMFEPGQYWDGDSLVAGSSVAAYWITKDFSASAPWNFKEWEKVYYGMSSRCWSPEEGHCIIMDYAKDKGQEDGSVDVVWSTPPFTASGDYGLRFSNNYANGLFPEGFEKSKILRLRFQNSNPNNDFKLNYYQMDYKQQELQDDDRW